MAKVSGGNGTEVESDTSQPTSTITSIVTSQTETSFSMAYKLNGRNFILRSRSVQTILKGRGKFSHLDGSLPQPASTDPTLGQWEMHNSLVMSWPIHSMEIHIGEIYLLYPTAKAIWDAVSHAYSDLED